MYPEDAKGDEYKLHIEGKERTRRNERKHNVEEERKLRRGCISKERCRASCKCHDKPSRGNHGRQHRNPKEESSTSSTYSDETFTSTESVHCRRKTHRCHSSSLDEEESACSANLKPPPASLKPASVRNLPYLISDENVRLLQAQRAFARNIYEVDDEFRRTRFSFDRLLLDFDRSTERLRDINICPSDSTLVAKECGGGAKSVVFDDLEIGEAKKLFFRMIHRRRRRRPDVTFSEVEDENANDTESTEGVTSLDSDDTTLEKLKLPRRRRKDDIPARVAKYDRIPRCDRFVPSLNKLDGYFHSMWMRSAKFQDNSNGYLQTLVRCISKENRFPLKNKTLK